jgi:hypothetical protein
MHIISNEMRMSLCMFKNTTETYGIQILCGGYQEEVKKERPVAE